MAAPTCTAVALNTGCHGLENWSPKQQLALIVYFMVLELKALGGTDYTATLTQATAAGGLVYDAAQVFQTMNADQRMQSMIKIYKNNAAGAGASVPTLRSDETQAIKCLENSKIDQLDQMFLWLLCQLGHHTASN